MYRRPTQPVGQLYELCEYCDTNKPYIYPPKALAKDYYNDPDLILHLEATFGIWSATDGLARTVEDALNDT